MDLWTIPVAVGGAMVPDADTVLGVNTEAGLCGTIHGFAPGDLIDLNGLIYRDGNSFSDNASKDIWRFRTARQQQR